jgi:ribosomal protein L11 methylase PrmA
MRTDFMNLPSSFRDPSGFLFFKNQILYRQVNKAYKENYDYLKASGLYKSLAEANLLIPHEECDLPPAYPETAYKVLKPERIPFVSYPYEWCFSQLKDAALNTLKIQKIALEHQMSLKDASAYNIQFYKGKPILIDTLSFEIIEDWKPWVAYRQFCQHFLGPLLLMSYKDYRLNQLLRLFIDGIPLDLTSKLLPQSTRFRPGIVTHIHAHALSQKYFSSKTVQVKEKRISRNSLLGLIDSLESNLKKLAIHSKRSEWADYYQETNYTPQGFEHKKQILREFLNRMNPSEVWDLGANTGIFSRLASERKIPTLSFDIDPVAVEINYQECVSKNENYILPLVLDLTNPSPGVGWENEERMSLVERGPTDMVFALALLHHLAISNNLPFEKIASFLRKICHSLVIEFVPKSDSQVQRLLVTREDIFSDYTQPFFEKEFSRYFTIQESVPIKDSERALYLMEVSHESN